jgi:hypothetical protein
MTTVIALGVGKKEAEPLAEHTASLLWGVVK